MAKVSSLHQQFFIGDILRASWKIFLSQWPFLLGMMVLVVLSSMIPSFILKQVKDVVPSPVPEVLSLLAWIFQMVVGMGVTKIYIDLARGEKATFGTLLDTWPQLIKYLVGTILYGLIVLVGILLFIIPGLIFGMMFMYTPYLIIDKGMGPIAALKASKQMTDGVKWDLVGFGAVMMTVVVLGFLALFVGVLIAAPVAAIAEAMMYNHLLARSEMEE